LPPFVLRAKEPRPDGKGSGAAAEFLRHHRWSRHDVRNTQAASGVIFRCAVPWRFIVVFVAKYDKTGRERPLRNKRLHPGDRHHKTSATPPAEAAGIGHRFFAVSDATDMG
jgi:hypothetical protein